MDCIFCKIIAGEIPAYKVYEDDKFFAPLDIKPLNPGHTLVIPKKHYRWVWDVPEAGEYFLVARRIALAQKKAFATDYIVATIFGEAVPHAHIHLIPRHENDGHGGTIDWGNEKKLSPEQMRDAADKIKLEL